MAGRTYHANPRIDIKTGKRFPAVTFTQSYNVDTVRLIEIEPYMEQELVDGKVEIRGGLNDECHIVSSEHTYWCRSNENSNAMLMITAPGEDWVWMDPRDKLERQDDMYCFGAATSIYTLTRVPAKVAKLQEILKPYNGDESIEAEQFAADDDDDDFKMDVDAPLETDQRMYNTEDLKQRVQASDKQTATALKTIGAFKLSGFWRLLDREYEIAVFDDILNSMAEHSMNYKEVSLKKILETTTDYPPSLVEHVLKRYCTGEPKNDGDLFELDEHKVCIFRAKQISVERGEGGVSTAILMEDWPVVVPPGMNPTIEMLTSHLRQNEKKNWVVFDEEHLSMDVKTRFRELFSEKDVWAKPEMELYLKSLLEAGHDFDKLLLRNAKGKWNRIKGKRVRVYSKKIIHK